MSVFHEAIKQILQEVDKFLNQTLKKESLSKPAQNEKARIADSIKKIYEEYEVLNPFLDDASSTSSSRVADESRFTSSSSHSHGSEEDGYSENIPYTTIKALKDPTRSGYLLKKPTDFLEKMSKGKKYCVVHKNAMYWFKKPGDKKQQGAVLLNGYEFKDITQNDKEILFELYSTKKKCFQFQADSQKDLEDWKTAIEKGIRYHVDQKPLTEELEEDLDAGSGEEYEDIGEMANAMRNFPAPPPAAKEPITAKTLPPLPSSPQSPPQQPQSPQDIYDDGLSMPAQQAVDEDNLIYEDVGQSSPNDNTLPPKPMTEEPRSSIPLTPPPRPPSPLPKVSQEPPPLPSRSQNFSLPSTAANASPALPPKKRVPKLDKISLQEDYENLFYGIWSCVGGTMNELSFDKGDVIHILNQDLDSESWWIGEKGGSIGLVPKAYLSPAYELVA